MTNNDFEKKILKGYVDFSNKNTPLRTPLRLFSIWPETNFMLDEFYSKPNIKIGNDKKGLRIKNSMRHIVGSARQYQNYPHSAEFLGNVKEFRDKILQPFEYMKHNRSLDYSRYLNETLNDTKIDQENNQIGRNYIKQNPNATDEDIMQYAFQQALLNYDRQYNVEPSKDFQQRLLEKKGTNNYDFR